jgi:SAM-dependent methyltransferase
VQSPEADIEFFVARYKELRGREPKVLREDFCGTAYISATWAGSGKDRRAIGVDLDAATLEWGREHNLAALPKGARSRVELRQANVLDGGGERSDLTCAMNFSYGVFKTRAELRHYLEVVHQQLADDGVFVTELYGGTEAIVAIVDEREIEGDEDSGDFTYQWEQASYNPITHETLCHIHFVLRDESRIERAFTYDWRLWSIAEVRELLYEVGFSSVRVYWEAVDEDGDGTGEYYATEAEENQESWLVYLVAGK